MGVQRRAKSPALHCGHKQVPARQRQPSARPDGGPMKSSAPTQRGGGTPPAFPGSATLLPCIVGRAFTPAGGGLAPAQKDTRKARRRTPQSANADITGLRYPHHAAHAEACLHSATAASAPSRCIRRRRRLTPQPLTGEPSGRQSPKASPARGGGCAARCRRRGALPLGGGNIRQIPAGPCLILRRGRCWHRPGNPAMPQTPGGGRNRPPYIAAGSGRQQIRARHPPGPPTGR